MAGRIKEFGVRSEIEIFDLSHLHGERRLADKGLLNERPHIQFVMGMQNALPAGEGLLETLLNEAKRLSASNAKLVSLAADTLHRHGRSVATPDEACTRLGLKPSR